MMFPKPPRPERGTAAASRHMAAVAQLPCVCCYREPVVVHHVIHGRFAQRRASDFDTIPLCPEHHDELHLRPRAWRDRWGPDHGFLDQVKASISER